MTIKKTILSVTAHPDDEVLGFGATAAKLSAEGHDIINCILSGNVEARQFRPEIEELHRHIKTAEGLMGAKKTILGKFPNIQFNSVPHLELVQFIEGVIEEVEPDYIFTHHPYDLNNDHYHVSKSCQAACRLSQRKKVKPVKGLYFMEVPSSTDWGFSVDSNSFAPNTYFEIGKEFLDVKLKALEAYKNVMRPYPHPRSLEGITGLAAYRGGQAGLNYAEAFQSVYKIIDSSNL